jgi:ribonuclease HI
MGGQRPAIDIELTKEVSKHEQPAALAALTREKITEYRDSVHIYTDASKTCEGKVGIGCYVKETQFFSAIGHQARITDEVSVFAGELAAIRLAFEYVSQLSKASGQARFTIFSDSLSAIKTVQKGHCTSRPKLFHQLLEVISKSDAETTLVWVPSHIGIHGNEQADRLANAAIQSGSVELEIGIEVSDELPEVDRYVLRKWQEEWENQPTAVSYRRLEPVVGRRERFRFGSRTAETMAHRLEIREMRSQRSPTRHAQARHWAVRPMRGTGDGPAFFCWNARAISGRREKLCDTFQLPHTLEAVLADAAILRYICRTTDRRL